MHTNGAAAGYYFHYCFTLPIDFLHNYLVYEISQSNKTSITASQSTK